MGELRHGGDLRRERLLVTLGLLETQDVWGLFTHPLGGVGKRERESEREMEILCYVQYPIKELPRRERDKQQTNEKCSQVAADTES